LLQPGERRPCLPGTAANERYRTEGHRIWFFYLNTGTDNARVEIPEWAASRPETVSLVHAAVIDQCRFNNGYPYVLTRADEQAVSPGEERETAGGDAGPGDDAPRARPARAVAQAQQKQVARWRRR